MRLSVKALAVTAAVFAGGRFLLIGLLNLAFPTYGVAFLELGASIYPAYAGPAGFGSVIVATPYGVVDAAASGRDCVRARTERLLPASWRPGRRGAP